MAAPEFPIPTRDLDAAGKGFRFPVRVAWMRGAFEGTSVGPNGNDGELELRASKTGEDVVVRGSLRARVVVPCARCLDPAHVTVDETLTALAVPAPAAIATGKKTRGGATGRADREPHNGDDDDADALEDVDALAFDGETVVLDGLVRDELLLAIPMIPLCSPSCTGISIGPQAGDDDGVGGARVDPRLSPLLRLKKT